MENLRAYMLVNSIKELCGESDFTYEPQAWTPTPPLPTRLWSPALCSISALRLTGRALFTPRYRAPERCAPTQSIDQTAPPVEPAQPAPQPAAKPGPPRPRLLRPAPAPAPTPAPAPQATPAPRVSEVGGRALTTRRGLISVNLNKLESAGRCGGRNCHYRIHGHRLPRPQGAEAGRFHQVRPPAAQAHRRAAGRVHVPADGSGPPAPSRR